MPTGDRTDQAVNALEQLSSNAQAVRGPDYPKILDNLRAKYDAAQSTNENTAHWANADLLSPPAANSWQIRRTVRTRARYEVANNSYARGIVLTLANDVVGTGPRLQMLTDDAELNRTLEGHFANWSRAVNLAGKLRTMRMAKAQDGEGFAVLVSNPTLNAPVKLDLRLLEADRVSTPTVQLSPDENKAIDGIVFDDYGNPAEYHVLGRHPGALGAGGVTLDYETVPAASMLHWFRPDRPGQRRGLPDIMPALPLFALLRRFTLATLTAAETAADWGVIMSTNAPADGEAAEVDPWVTMQLRRNMALFSPEGWTPSQLKAEHPNAEFATFRRSIINEIARCLNMPLNVAAGDSSDYNFASGKLDHATYEKSIRVEHSLVEVTCMDRILEAWLIEALRVPEYGIFGQIERIFWPHQWMWPGREEIDPRWAKALIAQVQAGLLTEAEYHARRGLDWEGQQIQREREHKGRIKRELPEPGKPMKATLDQATARCLPSDLPDLVADEIADQTGDE